MFNTGIFDNSASGESNSGDGFLNAPQPIDITYQRQASIFNTLRFRRESIAHSQGIGGVSWGSVTIGLWLKDEVMMYGASQTHSQGGSGVHNNLINRRRGLLRYGSIAHHYNMLMLPPNATSYLPNLEADYCKDYSCCGQLLPTLHDLLRHYEEAHISTSPPHENSVHLHEAHRTRNNMSNIHNVMETVSTNDVFLNNHANQLQPLDGALHVPATYFHIQQQTISQGSMTHTILPSLTLEGAVGDNELPNINHDRSTGVLSQMGQNRQLGHAARTRANTTANSTDLDRMYIDDPARHLYVMENEDYKPFKCPVIGCEKTYKNQNGLKYHRLHGHQNQTLKENDDGSYSIIDPESNTPYLLGAGMDKDKPYRCEKCCKRYKNLNGLKYHRGHTTH